MADDIRAPGRWLAAVLAGGLLSVSLLVPAILSAQEERTVIVVDAEVRAVGEEYHGGYLQVYADGELCGELSFTDPAARTPGSGAEFELGLDGQPEACGRDGARITFFDGNGVGLGSGTEFTLQPGATVAIDWIRVGRVRIEPVPSSDGRTLLTVDPELRTGVAQRNSPYLDVYADRELCGRFNFVEAEEVLPDESAAFELGTGEQPEACGRDGAVISLINALGTSLSAVYRLDIGWQIPVQNFTIPPPHTGDDAPPAPGAPEAGSGLAPGPGDSGSQVAGMVAALIILVAAVGLALGARRSRTRPD
jgi:hypothetical protein